MGRDLFKSRFSVASTTLLDEDETPIATPRRRSVQLLVNEHISCNENIGKVMYMGACFLVLFTAFTSIQNLMSEIYEQLGHDSLGQFTLLALYAVFGIAVFIVPSLLENWSHKKGICIGSFAYIFPIIAGSMTTACTKSNPFWCASESYIYASNIVAASITGFGAAIMWLSVNRYITACANESNKGRFMGIFFSFFSCSSVFGNLMAAFIIEDFGQFGFYISASILAFIAIVMMAFAKEVPKYDEEISEDTVKEKAIKILRLASSEKMRVLLPYLFFVGLVLAIYSGFEFEIITSTIPYLSTKNQDFMTAMVFLVQGVMSIVSSYAAGKLDDILTRYKVLNIFNGIFILAVIFSFLSYVVGNIGLTFLMGILWGMGYAGASTLTGVIMAKDFYGSIEAYAVLQLVSNIAIIIGFLFCIYVKNIIVFLFIILGFLVLSLISTFHYKPQDTTSALEPVKGEIESDYEEILNL